MCKLALSTLFLCLTAIVNAQIGHRTVIDKELGSLYQNPGSIPWTAYGMFVGSPATLDPQAYRVLMAHFDQFASEESLAIHLFPYAEFAAYDAAERAAGRPGLFITATYAGKSRPVYFPWSMGIVNGVPTAPQNQWQRAVNVGDTRFIHFWINHYAEQLMSTYQNWPKYGPKFGPNLGLELDQCAFIYSLYGVLDDNGSWVSGVTWDQPFPENQAAFEMAIERFFSQVKTLAPNLVLLPNIGGQYDPTHFPALFDNVEGILLEDLYGWKSKDIPFVRNEWYTQNFQYLSWAGAQNKLNLLRALIPSGDANARLSSFVMYALFKGPNTFYAPSANTYSLDPSTWAGMRAQLGRPLGAIVPSSPSSQGQAYRLYARLYEGGTVYLNWTGRTQTIQLGSGVYYDPNGDPLSSHSISIPDGTGTYVTTVPKALPAPQISPRSRYTYTAPLKVTIQTKVAGGTIHYTLNSTTPTTESPTYTGPITLTSSATVAARVFSGTNMSFSSTASYTLATGQPTVGLVVTSDSGLSGVYYPVVQLSAIPASPVTVSYAVTNGTPATGSYTFLPGMTYGVLPVVTGASGWMTVTLTGVTGATMNQDQAVQYTIQ